jgi:hypothetical protein
MVLLMESSNTDLGCIKFVLCGFQTNSQDVGSKPTHTTAQVQLFAHIPRPTEPLL